MKHRFETGRSSSNMKNLIISIAVFALAAGCFYFGVSSVSDKTIRQEQETLENAVNRSIVHCYAIEGSYPESLSYLKTHYGLTYDEDRFFIDYQTIGSNIMPDVTIIKKEEAK